MNQRPRGWPSPVWWATLGAGVVSVLLIALGVWLDYERDWSFLEKYYLKIYAKTWLAGVNPIPHKSEGRYQLLEGVPQIETARRIREETRTERMSLRANVERSKELRSADHSDHSLEIPTNTAGFRL
jgi:hypothetical protein